MSLSQPGSFTASPFAASSSRKAAPPRLRTKAPTQCRLSSSGPTRRGAQLSGAAWSLRPHRPYPSPCAGLSVPSGCSPTGRELPDSRTGDRPVRPSGPTGHGSHLSPESAQQDFVFFRHRGISYLIRSLVMTSFGLQTLNCSLVVCMILEFFQRPTVSVSTWESRTIVR